MARLLLVEDNRALNDMVATHLRERGFAVDAVGNGAAALGAAAATTYDAVILDLGLPDMDGMEVLRRLRAGAMPPTLILTARDNVAHRIAGLNEGADDYVLKPFDLVEFEARLRAVLRRPGAREAPCPTFGDLSFDTTRQVARVADRSVELTRREAALCEELIRHGERIVVRDALNDLLYDPGDDVSSNALEATVSRFRRKLATLDSTVRVETVRGIGYRLAREPDDH